MEVDLYQIIQLVHLNVVESSPGSQEGEGLLQGAKGRHILEFCFIQKGVPPLQFTGTVYLIYIQISALVYQDSCS